MSVLKSIEDDLKIAMKERNAEKLSVLRMLKAAVKNKEIELIRPLSEAEFVSVLSTQVKQRRDSADQYQKANRDDLATKELGEIKIIQAYLPKQLSETEITAIVQAAINEVKPQGPQDMGKIMGALKTKTAGRVDGKLLADKVKSALQNLN